MAKYGDGKKSIEEELGVLKKHCTVIRVLVHTQIKKIGFGQKKAHLAEIQVRGAVVHVAWRDELVQAASGRTCASRILC